ncbi:MAG: ABC transporter ATP-binding protein [Rhodocyclaceae bacterium]|nr:ABC transporter ATP-binding protein [Rhodocyclaceae bacterium]
MNAINEAISPDAGVAVGNIEINGVGIELGRGADRFEAVRNLDLDIPAGQFVCLLGPSGCGKSTLLGAIAGHIRATHGAVRLDGERINGPHPDRGLVFQHHTLFPWKKVIDNVAFGLKMKGVAKAERNKRALELIKLVGLGGFENRYPAQLSGGMQQRVEIARVLINHPRVLLMDEPFGALDALTRNMMQELLLEVWEKIRTTVVFVTHDIDEALFLADRVIVMTHRPGRLLADIPIGFPRPRNRDLLTAPEFVAIKRQCLHLLHGEHEQFKQADPLQRLSPLGPSLITETQVHLSE